MVMSNELLEATNMLESLRVVELRSLLSTMGKAKNGLKKELVRRATELLHRESRPELFSTIRELYRVRHSANDTAGRRSGTIAKPTPTKVIAVPTADSHNKPDAMDYSPFPEVQMTKIPFYHTLETIVPPTSLVPKPVNTLQNNYFSIHLTERQWTRIKDSQEAQDVQVVLRLCITESIGVDDDQYPPRIAVYVNGLYCFLQVRYASRKEGVEPSRPCCPINLTPLLDRFTDNHVNVLWQNFGKHYSAAVYLVRVLSSVDLLKQLKTKAVESQENCRQKIWEMLRWDSENEISTTRLQVSLICPLAKMRMSAPCRAQTCTHLQCFDAASYLQMNERKPGWTCPVCHRPAPFETLRIDSLLSSIIHNTEEEVEDIEYLSNGSWKTLGEKRQCSEMPDPSARRITNSPVSLDIVDLTQDSSDDDVDDVQLHEEIALMHL
ncbi:E3 SUMO-protein ligase PIAS4b [Brachyhypopomus gauderio]|uniref:E3 SUMO-protein ligase PIAS4b n=1 Tax=Brachyhypopomus gauderio TaxID=698409 RepID=UPI004041CBA8